MRLCGRTARRHGFTLVELAVVIVIIGVLAAFGVPRFLKSVERAKAAEAFAYLSAVRSAQERYRLAVWHVCHGPDPTRHQPVSDHVLHDRCNPTRHLGLHPGYLVPDLDPQRALGRLRSIHGGLHSERLRLVQQHHRSGARHQSDGHGPGSDHWPVGRLPRGVAPHRPEASRELGHSGWCASRW